MQLGSGSTAKGSDGVSWESLEKVILLKRRCNGGSDLVNVQVINTTYALNVCKMKTLKMQHTFNTENDYGLVTMNPDCRVAVPVSPTAVENTVLSDQQKSLM